MTPAPSGAESAPPSGDAEPVVDIAQLIGLEWVATSLAGVAPDPAVAPRISFEAGRISGFAGCNSFGGDVRIVEGGRLAIGELALTLMLCTGPAGDVERAFLRALGLADTIAFEGDTLVIDGPGGRLEFVRNARG